ncbi:Fic family protein [Paraburkholderia sp. BL21I4N1]|uniref:Fic/DOC family protein n=1 Tax=Paraburkholderia sp. BL21I4N1 TaxID=1938801 RepID=UPI000CFD4C93|nr:Fic family protein [Paraburkholderia sp. BL21I4N1]PQV44110.1 cell filamentation protein [Paraburkholderia sp. BL21I4N1]
MFDPFGDYETRGYLRNVDGIKDLDELRYIEHGFFESNLEAALAYLHAIEGSITYVHFLEVHRILFSEFYPWAGQDRHALGVGRLVGKGQRIQFEASELCQRAIEWGLSAGNSPKAIREKPGMVMGAFAWGHPFLDGNGRTMLLVHAELCHRAGFAINWNASRKDDYLESLTRELENPQGKHLDAYLLPLMVSPIARGDLRDHLMSLPGLNGEDRDSAENIAYRADDAEANRTYLELKRARGET